MPYPLSVTMHPSLLYKNDMLLRTQLNCLSQQTNKDFDVWIFDHHYATRKRYMSELSSTYRLDIKHIPYRPHPTAARIIDCIVFQAGYCFSESAMQVRYSDWRFVSPDFTEECCRKNTDFYFLNCSPPTPERVDPEFGHDIGIWNGESDQVQWENVPKHGQRGADWGEHSEVDAPSAPMPLNCYGNFAISRKDWLKVNGTDEVMTGSCHAEDQSLCIRFLNANVNCRRKANIMWRLHHYYSKYDGRSNIKPDYDFVKPCDKCLAAQNVHKPQRWDISKRLKKNEIEIIDNCWICPECRLAGPVYHEDEGEYFNRYLRHKSITQATIVRKYKLGRNLRILTEAMDGKSLEEKVQIYQDSWDNERYFVK